MIRINLLPVRQTRKFEAARWEFLLAVAGGVLVVVLGGAGWGLAEYRLSALQSENAALQAEIDKLADEVKKVDEMEKYKAELQRKLAVIDELRGKKTGPVHMLDEIATATPEKLQLTKMSERAGSIHIEGVSVNNDTISNFLRSLDASAYLDQVFLEDIQALTDKSLTVPAKSFKLTAHLVTPGKDAAKDVNPAGASAGAAVPAPVPAAPPAPGAAPATPAPTDPAAPPPATPPAAAPAGTTAPPAPATGTSAPAPGAAPAAGGGA